VLAALETPVSVGAEVTSWLIFTQSKQWVKLFSLPFSTAILAKKGSISNTFIALSRKFLYTCLLKERLNSVPDDVFQVFRVHLYSAVISDLFLEASILKPMSLSFVDYYLTLFL